MVYFSILTSSKTCLYTYYSNELAGLLCPYGHAILKTLEPWNRLQL